LPNAVARDIVFPFNGTNVEANALIDWSRDTDFDGRYVLGCNSEDLTGGATGGSATHGHICTAVHKHSLTSSAASDTGATDPNGIVSTATPAHQHLFGSLSDNTPTVVDATNDLSYFEVIFCKSNGTPTTIPQKFFFYSDDNSVNSPFSLGYTQSTGSGGTPDLRSRYFKGAEAGGDAGDSANYGDHSHDFTHNHTSPATSGTSQNQQTQGQLRTGLSKSHTHGVTITNDITTNSATADGQPPYKVIVPYYSTGASNVLETGMIALWKGGNGDIPTNWSIVDTMFSVFLKSTSFAYGEGDTSYADVGTTGGADSHDHTSSHKHVGATASISSQGLLASGVNIASRANHTHTWTISTESANFKTSSTKANYPLYITCFYIKYTAPTGTRTNWFNWFCRLFTFGSTEATFGDTHVTFGGRYVN